MTGWLDEAVTRVTFIGQCPLPTLRFRLLSDYLQHKLSSGDAMDIYLCKYYIFCYLAVRFRVNGWFWLDTIIMIIIIWLLSRICHHHFHTDWHSIWFPTIRRGQDIILLISVCIYIYILVSHAVVHKYSNSQSSSSYYSTTTTTLSDRVFRGRLHPLLPFSKSNPQIYPWQCGGE